MLHLFLDGYLEGKTKKVESEGMSLYENRSNGLFSSFVVPVPGMVVSQQIHSQFTEQYFITSYLRQYY